MDVVIGIHGQEEVYNGVVPKTLDEAHGAFLRMAGFSKYTLQAFDLMNTNQPVPPHLLNAKRQDAMANLHKPVALHDRVEILSIFKRKYVTDPASGLQYDIKAIETLLASMRTATDDVSLPSREGKPKRRLRRERKHQAPKFSVIQLLSVLEEGIRSEMPTIRFDYVSMHLRCLQYLGDVHMVSQDYIERKIGQPYLVNQAELPFMVGWILMFARLGAKATELQTGIDRNSSTLCSKLLLGAADQLRSRLAEKGWGDKEVRPSDVL